MKNMDYDAVLGSLYIQWEREREEEREEEELLSVESPPVQTVWRQMASSNKYSTLTLFPCNFFCVSANTPTRIWARRVITVERERAQERGREREGEGKRESKRADGVLYTVWETYSVCWERAHFLQDRVKTVGGTWMEAGRGNGAVGGSLCPTQGTLHKWGTPPLSNNVPNIVQSVTSIQSFCDLCGGGGWCVLTCMCINVCACVRVFKCGYLSVFMCVYLRVYVYLCVCMCVHVCVSVHVFVFSSVCLLVCVCV